MARQILKRFAGLRAGERVLILAETEADDRVKTAFHRAARELAGADVALVTYDRRPPYTHPPEPVPHAVMAADLVVALDIYLSHTRLEKAARAAGARFLNLHPADFAALRRAVLGVDHTLIRQRARKLARIFGASRQGLITCRSGSKLSFDIDGSRNATTGDGVVVERGGYATLPTGKIKVPVVRTTLNGVFVVNGVIIPPINELTGTVTLRFKRGRVVEIAGGRDARAYARFLASFDEPSMYAFDHLTFGFNPKASLRQPPAPRFSSEAEKVMGSINIGLGSAGLRGKQHTDVVSVGCTVALDGKPIIAAGRYTTW
ncbi:MAG: hypothetical protein FJX35_10535 [Alphaproteobacteria bacterium]|nr:hypothetical protein [Alphaproteobacteria bacterium]